MVLIQQLAHPECMRERLVIIIYLNIKPNIKPNIKSNIKFFDIYIVLDCHIALELISQTNLDNR